MKNQKYSTICTHVLPKNIGNTNITERSYVKESLKKKKSWMLDYRNTQGVYHVSNKTFYVAILWPLIVPPQYV